MAEKRRMTFVVTDNCISCKIPTAPDLHDWLALNAEYASVWPNIAIKRDQPADANAFDGEANKLARYFSPRPRLGD
ncbi:DUF3470 domain-containing protein [Mesorhizobium sp. Root695]|jgi:ferredoxin|uniref:DUF3470 domain-containing protein n=1 Tax=Mesorhizobium sp. Root695 TaxID=1736589 RepID=UPI0039B76A0A